MLASVYLEVLGVYTCVLLEVFYGVMEVWMDTRLEVFFLSV